MNDLSNIFCPLTVQNTSVSEPWAGERVEVIFSDVYSECSNKDDSTRSKADVLLEISRNPDLYVDEVAKRLGMSTKLAVELVGDLIDECIIEYAE